MNRYCPTTPVATKSHGVGTGLATMLSSKGLSGLFGVLTGLMFAPRVMPPADPPAMGISNCKQHVGNKLPKRKLD